MKKTLLFVVLTALVACSSMEPVPGRFASIAEEWQGGNVQDMIEVWGDPKSLTQASADGEGGVARWKYVSGSGSPSGEGGSRRSRCEATAYFDAKGLISDIEVVSQRCDNMVGSYSLEKLRRP